MIKKTRQRAITLFELTVVVAVAVILVGIFVFTAQQLLVRTKVSRVKEEHRIITRALQNYQMDYSILPSAGQGLNVLTKPTAYLGRVPDDPFQELQGGYLYIQPGRTEIASVLISPGPDGDFDLPQELWMFASQSNVKAEMIPMRTRTLRKAMRSGEVDMEVPQKMSDTDMAILRTYLEFAQYNAEKSPNGDIITVLNY